MRRVATRANALWQSHDSIIPHYKLQSRNPRECAVAKMCALMSVFSLHVATRANALWQRSKLWQKCNKLKVATRANALWQRYVSGLKLEYIITSQPARMRCGKDCAPMQAASTSKASQPARMRCGKGRRGGVHLRRRTSQPARMRCGKVRPQYIVSVRLFVATRANALWQRQG